MERTARASLGTLVTALAVVFAVAALLAAAALAGGSSDTGSSAGPDGARADLIQDGQEQEPDDGLPFDEEDEFDFFGDGPRGEDDCPFGEDGFRDGPEGDPGGETPNDDAADPADL
jgi:hypothetical protein